MFGPEAPVNCDPAAVVLEHSAVEIEGCQTHLNLQMRSFIGIPISFMDSARTLEEASTSASLASLSSGSASLFTGTLS